MAVSSERQKRSRYILPGPEGHYAPHMPGRPRLARRRAGRSLHVLASPGSPLQKNQHTEIRREDASEAVPQVQAVSLAESKTFRELVVEGCAASTRLWQGGTLQGALITPGMGSSDRVEVGMALGISNWAVLACGGHFGSVKRCFVGSAVLSCSRWLVVFILRGATTGATPVFRGR